MFLFLLVEMYADALVSISEAEVKMSSCVHVGETRVGTALVTPVWEIDVEDVVK